MIDNIIKENSKTILTPRDFFVSWYGVLTLAYSGFTPSLMKIKNGIKINFPDLKSENEGSKWPKTTLGALKDGHKLTYEELVKIWKINQKFKVEKKFESYEVKVEDISVALFGCRSLERIISNYKIELKDPLDKSPPSNEERKLVYIIALFQFDYDYLKTYWKEKVSKPENRESYYRMKHIESTLVSFIKDNRLKKLCNEFKGEVEKELGDMKYVWFSDESLHITIRALT